MKIKEFKPAAREEAVVDALARCELAAALAYRIAVDAGWAPRSGAELARIKGEHEEAARLLRGRLADRGAHAPPALGLWSALTGAEGAAKLIEEKAALEALKEGEERGIQTYHEAIDNARISPEIKTLITESLLPRAWSHAATLERLLQDGA